MNNLYSVIFLLVGLLSTVVSCTDVKPDNDAEKQILQFFQRWRNGDTSPFELPPLDVIIIPPFNGSYSGKGIKITFSSSEMHLMGVNKFSVVELNVSLTSLRASGILNIPSLTITADNYELQGKAFYVYKLKGSGKLDVTLNDIKLQFDIRLANVGNGTSTKVIEMKLDFVIEDIQANLENSSWPVNKLLNTEGIQILNGYRDDIITATQVNLVETLDNYLSTVTPEELMFKIHDAPALI